MTNFWTPDWVELNAGTISNFRASAMLIILLIRNWKQTGHKVCYKLIIYRRISVCSYCYVRQRSKNMPGKRSRVEIKTMLKYVVPYLRNWPRGGGKVVWGQRTQKARVCFRWPESIRNHAKHRRMWLRRKNLVLPVASLAYDIAELYPQSPRHFVW